MNRQYFTLNTYLDWIKIKIGITSGTLNKISSEVKGKLESLIEGVVGSLDINEMDTNQRIKLLQIALQYTLINYKQLL